ncbi:MAG: 4'-phosphopantetheinyl transferase EntD [Paraglaciecola sp.]|jgi:enterobactin synthetase component D
MVPFLTEPLSIKLPYTDVVAFQCYFDVDAFTIEQALILPIPFPAQLMHAVKRRQAAYFAGRNCARYALLRLNAETTHVLKGEKQQPLWPNGQNGQKLGGSITHSGNIALCIAAEQNNMSHLGIDIEQHMTEKVAKEIENTVINKVEKQRLTAVDLEFAEALTLIFSAKETIFKALFYDIGDYFSFDAAELLYLDLDSCIARFSLTTTLTSIWPQGSEIDIHFQRFSEHVLTYHVQQNV